MYHINRSKYVIDKKIFKKLENTEIWEFRTLFNGIQYRIFAFWDNDTDSLVITTHGIIKKNAKNATKGDSKSRSNKKGIF